MDDPIWTEVRVTELDRLRKGGAARLTMARALGIDIEEINKVLDVDNAYYQFKRDLAQRFVERALREQTPQDPVSMLLGDPPPGRSALAQQTPTLTRHRVRI